jgi:hypothetical protein
LQVLPYKQVAFLLSSGKMHFTPPPAADLADFLRRAAAGHDTLSTLRK